MGDPLEVLQELIGDVKASGKQYYAFQEYKNEQGERVFYHTNGTLWWQRAQERALELGGPNTGVLSVIFSMDATFVKKNTYFRPLYSMYFICFHMFSHVFICFHKYFFQFLLAISWCTWSDSDVSYRRKEITHEGIRAVLEKWREVFAKPFDFLCADSKYRRLIPTLHFLNLDGQEIAMHTMCSILNCPVCNVPRSELGNPDFKWELRDSREVQIKYFILKLIKLCVNVYRLFEINVKIYESI